MRHIQYQGETLPPSPLVLAFHLVLGKFLTYVNTWRTIVASSIRQDNVSRHVSSSSRRQLNGAFRYDQKHPLISFVSSPFLKHYWQWNLGSSLVSTPGPRYTFLRRGGPGVETRLEPESYYRNLPIRSYPTNRWICLVHQITSAR